MEAQSQLGLQGQLLQFIGNSFALGAGGRRQRQEHWFLIIFASPSSVQPIHSNDGRGQAHHTGEIHLGFRDGNRLVRLLARAPRLAPLRCQPLTYPPEPQGPVRLHQDGERSARAEGAWLARTRGWGGWDGRSRRRGHRRHDRCRLYSATEATGPPTTLGPASAPPPPGSDSRVDQSET